MESKPITQRAKCKYESKTPQMEVAVDAAGTQPASLPSTSPAKQVVNVGGQAARLNVPKIESYYTGGNEALIKGSSRVIGSMPGEKMSDEAWENYLANETPEQKAARHRREEEAGVRITEQDKTESTPGFTTEIISQDYDLLEEKRDVYKPMQQRRAARAQKIASRNVRRAQKQFDKGKISKKELGAYKARLDAATEAATAGRNVMTRATYSRPKSGTGLPEYQGGTTRRIIMDNGDTFETSDNNSFSPSTSRSPNFAPSSTDDLTKRFNFQTGKFVPRGSAKKASPIYKMGGYGAKAYKK